MAKSSTSFKPGQIANPNGKPPLPPDLKLLMRNTSEQMKRDICEVYSMTLKDMLDHKEVDQTTISAGRAALISCVNNSFQTGDFKALNVVLDRILGKVPEAPIETEDANTAATKDQTIARLVEIMNDKPKTT